MTSYAFRRATEEDTPKIIDLMKEAFPAATIYTKEYLEWLYWRNPAGAALGMNAWDGDTLVGHVASVPQRVVLHDEPTTVVLLLNVATATSARGKGLFLELVRQLEAAAIEEGYAAITGVANQQTCRAYENKLGFQTVGSLNAHIEFVPHKIDFHWALNRAQFWREWDEETLKWRFSNPHNKLDIAASSADSITVEGASSVPMIRARAIIPRRGMSANGSAFKLGPAVVLGMNPVGTERRRLAFKVPYRLRPSPLRFVYKNLRNQSDRLDASEVLFSFLDFDAF